MKSTVSQSEHSSRRVPALLLSPLHLLQPPYELLPLADLEFDPDGVLQQGSEYHPETKVQVVLVRCHSLQSTSHIQKKWSLCEFLYG